MNREEILSEMQVTFRDVLDEEELVLTEELSADDVDGWDSLTHVQLQVALEKQFGIKFTAKESLMWENVGDIVTTIMNRLK